MINSSIIFLSQKQMDRAKPETYYFKTIKGRWILILMCSRQPCVKLPAVLFGVCCSSNLFLLLSRAKIIDSRVGKDSGINTIKQLRLQE